MQGKLSKEIYTSTVLLNLWMVYRYNNNLEVGTNWNGTWMMPWYNNDVYMLIEYDILSDQLCAFFVDT
jgi:hypothetical protein